MKKHQEEQLDLAQVQIQLLGRMSMQNNELNFAKKYEFTSLKKQKFQHRD